MNNKIISILILISCCNLSFAEDKYVVNRTARTISVPNSKKEIVTIPIYEYSKTTIVTHEVNKEQLLLNIRLLEEQLKENHKLLDEINKLE